MRPRARFCVASVLTIFLLLLAFAAIAASLPVLWQLVEHLRVGYVLSALWDDLVGLRVARPAEHHGSFRAWLSPGKDSQNRRRRRVGLPHSR